MGATLFELNRMVDPLVKLLYEDESVREHVLSYTYPTIASVIYLVSIYGLGEVFKNRPLQISWVVSIHNFILCAISFLMATFTAYEGYLIWTAHPDLQFQYCDTSNYLRGRVWFWCVVFYFSKFYELFDTVILALRGRSLQFLHVYHHIIIMFLVLAFIRAHITYFWVGVVFNTTVHTFMYYYYFMDSLGICLWWKSHLTKLQIFQFCWGIFTWWPVGYVCGRSYLSLKDDMFVFWFNQGVLISFLFLFVRFYMRTYSRKPPTPSAKLNGSDHRNSNNTKSQNDNKAKSD
jgi:fatty acid elongase 3